MLTAAKFVLYIICRRIVTPSTQALALDHRNDIISNTIAVACGIIGMQFWSHLTLWRPTQKPSPEYIGTWCFRQTWQYCITVMQYWTYLFQRGERAELGATRGGFCDAVSIEGGGELTGVRGLNPPYSLTASLAHAISSFPGVCVNLPWLALNYVYNL